jgi:hypothetical protein
MKEQIQLDSKIVGDVQYRLLKIKRDRIRFVITRSDSSLDEQYIATEHTLPKIIEQWVRLTP